MGRTAGVYGPDCIELPAREAPDSASAAGVVDVRG